MQITPDHKSIDQFVGSQPTAETQQPEKVSRNQGTTPADKGLTEDQVQKQARAQQAETTQRSDNERTLQQQEQNLQVQPAAGKAAQRIDITV